MGGELKKDESVTERVVLLKTVEELLADPNYSVSGIDSGIILLAGGTGGRKELAAQAIQKMTGYLCFGEIRPITDVERLLYEIAVDEPVIVTIHANGIQDAMYRIRKIPVRSIFRKRFRVIIGVPNRFEHPEPVLYVLPDPFRKDDYRR